MTVISVDTCHCSYQGLLYLSVSGSLRSLCVLHPSFQQLLTLSIDQLFSGTFYCCLETGPELVSSAAKSNRVIFCYLHWEHICFRLCRLVWGIKFVFVLFLFVVLSQCRDSFLHSLSFPFFDVASPTRPFFFLLFPTSQNSLLTYKELQNNRVW